MEEEKYESAMQIILHAGNAKSLSLMAIDAAAEGSFDEAREHLEEACREMHEAHDMQMGFLQDEAAGKPVELNIVLVHAQDHLSMAILASDLAERMVDMYQKYSEGCDRSAVGGI